MVESATCLMDWSSHSVGSKSLLSLATMGGPNTSKRLLGRKHLPGILRSYLIRDSICCWFRWTETGSVEVCFWSIFGAGVVSCGLGSVPGLGSCSVVGSEHGSMPGLGFWSVVSRRRGSMPGLSFWSVVGSRLGSMPGLGFLIGRGGGSVPGLGFLIGCGLGSVPDIGVRDCHSAGVVAMIGSLQRHL